MHLLSERAAAPRAVATRSRPAIGPLACTATALLVALLAPPSAAATPPEATAAAVAAVAAGKKAEAARLLATRRHASAYSRIAALADQGDAGAALLALAMLHEGPSLYGSEWSASPSQLRRWTALAGTALRGLPAQITGRDRVE